MARPMFEMLERLNGRLSLHMPGHKGSLHFADTTELNLTDDLYAPQNGILEAERLMAASAKAGATVFLHGGSTAGIQAALMTYLMPLDKVILPRNAHLSAVSGCVIGGFEPVFADLTVCEDDYAYVCAQTLVDCINAHPKAKAVLVTRPDFYGGMIDLAFVVAAAHDRGMKVIVDEAHGAHLNWMRGMQNAIACGADACIQSAHKTLPALNAAAMLHLKNASDADRARGHARLIQSSSPSFLALMSMDDARDRMDRCGAEKLDALVRLTDAFCVKAQALGYGDARRQDRTRLVLGAPQGGKALAQTLEEQGIDVEMYDRRHIVCILSVMDDETTFDRLYKALEAIPVTEKKFEPLPPLTKAKRVKPLRESYFAPREWVPFEQAVGRVAAQSFGIYPPGIPLACAGERIETPMIQMLKMRSGMSTFGTQAGAIACLKEID